MHNYLKYLFISLLMIISILTGGCKAQHTIDKNQQMKQEMTEKDQKVIEYKKSCKKLALWTVQHYSGVKKLYFKKYSDYGAGGNYIHAYVNKNDDNLVFEYTVNSYKKARVLDFSIISKDEKSKKNIRKQKDLTRTIKDEDIQYAWKGK